ncbi:MAG TPA: hypothetical protein DEG17_09040 [Cyanobacteria bacterium UBA11149]|nr:hypothetical protein [Cyanobacteria bacterium UBA11367]HBE60749.1 hypothetical protein [Cyanobacteria bacterium UBA11366]HBK66829.1 hypothetical protein [Cyanobacteria bacterium UBA11166]HBR72820.1 hypothetical protein [Cyanobacteria bacterium UBA11159]HBS68227.1 hypothetical protein [Cyanobacteria bacterium UBA11153]HBW88999.1 hypothetical protein [Cyanobacteria bacterium UBA11149]HCA94986.1 hypothetical protein [Cyanobacteria bacterium UBA9226]
MLWKWGGGFNPHLTNTGGEEYLRYLISILAILTYFTLQTSARVLDANKTSAGVPDLNKTSTRLKD